MPHTGHSEKSPKLTQEGKKFQKLFTMKISRFSDFKPL